MSEAQKKGKGKLEQVSLRYKLRSKGGSISDLYALMQSIESACGPVGVDWKTGKIVKLSHRRARKP